MSVVSAVMVPHPPLIIPDIGNGEESKISNTINAYNEACEFIKKTNPDTIIIISPHSTYYSDYFHILANNENYGDFSNFTSSKIEFTLEYDNEFIDEISHLYKDCGTLGEKSITLDHGTMVPLYFLKNYIINVKYIVIGLSGLPLKEHYRLGMRIKDTADKLNRRVSIVASGDLSHRLLESGPYGYNSMGPLYDERIMNVMRNANFNELFDFDVSFLEEAAGCGHPSFTIMAGSFDKQNVESHKLSYEGPFGVGYGVCTFLPKKENKSRDFLDRYLIKEKNDINGIRNNESEYVKLSRTSVEHYVRNGKRMAIPNNLNDYLLNNKKAVFVTLHKYGNLRGCIGTILPSHNSIAEEIIENAIKACSEDNRFDPVTEEELNYITYSVDVLGDIESIDNKNKLNTKRYGVIVNSGYKRGLLLPNIDGIDTVDEQIKIAMKKGNISEDENITLQRFEVNRYY